MSSKKKTTDEELDQLEEDARQIPEERKALGRGPEVLRMHLKEAAQRKKQLTIRLDVDIVERFRELAGPDGSYQTLMNRALHEWLEAQSVGMLLRSEIEELAGLVREMKAERDSPSGR